MVTRFLRLLLAAVGLGAFCACLFPSVAGAQGTGNLSYPFTLTAVGQRIPNVNIANGGQSCSVVIYNTGTSFSITPQVASDGLNNPTPSWVTATSINSGSITGSGTFTGNVTSQGVSTFGGVLTALVGGPVTGVDTCTSAVGSITATVNGASPTPLPTASAGAPPVNAPPQVAEQTCFVQGGGNPAVTAGNIIAEQCDNAGDIYTAFRAAQPVSLPTNQPVVCISGCAGGAVATPIPTASAGAVPTQAPPVVSEGTCAVPAGATPNVTGGNIVAIQCQTNGAQNTYVVNATAAIPLPTASAGASPVAAPPVVAQNVCQYTAPAAGGANLPAATTLNSIAMACGPNGGVGNEIMPPSILPPTAINANISTISTTLLGPATANASTRTWFPWLVANSAVTETITIETSAAVGCTSPTILTVVPVVPGPNVIFAGYFPVAANTYLCALTSATGQVAILGSYQQAF